MAHLVIVEGPNTGASYFLKNRNTIGSAPSNTINIEDRRVAKHSVSINRVSHGYFITSIIPNKKIKINGEKLKNALLQHGDIITIAGTMILYLEEKEDFGDIARSAFFSIVDLEDISFELSYDGGARDKNKLIYCITPQQSNKDLVGVTNTKAGERFSTLINVSKAISELKDIDLLLNRILSIILKELPVDRGFIILIKHEKKCEIRAFQDNQKSAHSILYNKSITKKVLSNKTSMLYSLKSQSASYLSVPLNCKGKLLGLIQLESSDGYKFTHSDLDQIRKVALQTALAIENLITYDQHRKQRQNLIALERFSQFLSKYLDKEKIIEESLKAAQKLFNGERISILLIDKSGKYLKIAAAKGIDKKDWATTKIPVTGSIAGRTFRKKRSILIKNARNIPEKFRFKDISDLSYKTNSCILAPIDTFSYTAIGKKEAIGVICVTDKKDMSAFTAIDRNLLALLANQISIALTNATLYEKATIDPVTEVHTRGFFSHKLQKAICNSREKNTPLSLLMIDLDHFKKVNDTYTHQSGDCVLNQLGILLKKVTTENEIVGKYGGEEFVVVLNMGHREALRIANSIRKKVEKKPFKIIDGKEIFITLSVGVSTLRKTDVQALLIERADKALFIAKENGRNKVVSEKMTENPGSITKKHFDEKLFNDDIYKTRRRYK